MSMKSPKLNLAKSSINSGVKKTAKPASSRTTSKAEQILKSVNKETTVPFLGRPGSKTLQSDINKWNALKTDKSSSSTPSSTVKDAVEGSKQTRSQLDEIFKDFGKQLNEIGTKLMKQKTSEKASEGLNEKAPAESKPEKSESPEAPKNNDDQQFA